MALTQALATSFKVELATGTHNFTASTGDTFRIALFRSAGSLVGTFGPATTNYSEMGADEVTGTGYTAGGLDLTSVTPVSSGTTAILDFANVVFTSVTLTTSGALIYNSSQGNRAVAVLNFGSDRTVSAGDLEIQFPPADVQSAIIRIA